MITVLKLLLPNQVFGSSLVWLLPNSPTARWVKDRLRKYQKVFEGNKLE